MNRLKIVIAVIEIIAMLLTQFWFNKVSASSGLVISSLQTGSATNASAEFVKITNVSAMTIAIDGWKLKYASGTGTTFVTKATLVGNILSLQTILFATTAYASIDLASQNMVDGLAQAGGQVELTDGNNGVIDLVGWGNATHAEGLPAPAPDSGQVLGRKTDSTGNFIDTDNNLNDFTVTGLVTMPTPSPSPVPPQNNNPGLEAPMITELLPNPASPLTDDKDEFVELYNPNTVPFILSGYKLQTGSKFAYNLTFTDQILSPLSYSIFKSGNTPLALSNSEGVARLLDPVGNVVSQTGAYSLAPEGEAWALIDGSWQWTTTATPLAPNILTGEKAEATNKTLATKIISTKPKATSDVKAVATTKTAKTTAPKTSKPSNSQSATSQTAGRLHPVILAGVGSLAVLYSVYEYRTDLKNAIYRFKRDRALRRENRSVP